MLFITLIELALFIVMKAIEPSGVPLLPIDLGDRSFQFYEVGIFTIVLVLIVFSLYCTVRTLVRKQKKIVANRNYFILSKKFDIYWILIITTYSLVLCYSLLLYWAQKNRHYLTVGMLGPLSVILFLNAYLFYMMNDYNILQDISSLNK